MSNLLRQFLESDLNAKDFLQSLKEAEDPQIIDLKQDLLRIDQEIADIEIRKLEAPPDEVQSLDDQIESLNAEKEEIQADIESIKDNQE